MATKLDFITRYAGLTKRPLPEVRARVRALRDGGLLPLRAELSRSDITTALLGMLACPQHKTAAEATVRLVDFGCIWSDAGDQDALQMLSRHCLGMVVNAGWSNPFTLLSIRVSHTTPFAEVVLACGGTPMSAPGILSGGQTARLWFAPDSGEAPDSAASSAEQHQVEIGRPLLAAIGLLVPPLLSECSAAAQAARYERRA